MITRKARLAAAGLALGTAVSLVGMAGTAHARSTTVEANSNIRAAATTNSRLVGTTKGVSEAHVYCFTRGQYVKVGNYGTNVWYHVNVFDNAANPPHAYLRVYVWGGNVNVGADPAPGIPPC
ncbi:hypothetical protein ACFPM3_19230 [Streptomyces coeruleoprunus]|uniref:SH3 domain-containing protein n=1 Tax=Streptomyces coeruleoprunus TaxID=285563 RepID=A0ABV9XHQ1_9ACTN